MVSKGEMTIEFDTSTDIIFEFSLFDSAVALHAEQENSVEP
ncbi:MAG: hypothetical protein AAF633_10425 [Chloroflexota bacterium]